MAQLIVLDFDGTMTDAEQEGLPFREGYLEDIAILAGQPLDAVLKRASQLEAEVAANPDAHGWIYHGHTVAPAAVDPYLRIMPVGRQILDEADAFTDPIERMRLLDTILYKYNYQKTRTVFRDGARETLLALADTETHVVTNSYTDAVRAKVGELGQNGDLDWLIERVQGRAQKYVVEPDFDALPESMSLDGLERPVLLRRPHYHKVIAALLAQIGADWSDLLVVGDIFELDLALPLFLGARVALCVNEFTPAYEKRYIAQHPRGSILESVREIPALVAA